MPFVAGAAVADGEVGPEQIAEDRLADAAILEQTDKVELIADAEADALRPGMVPGRVKIATNDGRTFDTWVPYPRGAPENPLSEEELRNKFSNLSMKTIGAARTADLGHCLDRLEDTTDVNDLVAKLRPT